MSEAPKQTITLELERIDAEIVQSLVQLAVEKGDPIQRRAAIEFGNKLAQAMIEQVPGLRERAEEAIDSLAEEGAPEEIIEAVKAKLTGEPEAITEEEVETVDLDDTLDEILKNSNPKEAS